MTLSTTRPVNPAAGRITRSPAWAWPHAALWLAVLLAVTAGCAPRSGPAPEEAHAAHGTRVTLWTGQTELFMEVPPLVVGASDVFAVHLTRLADFAPLATGPVTFVFAPSGGGTPVVVTAESPRSPGIFGPAPVFPTPGRWDLEIRIESPDLTDTIRVPGLVVAATPSELPHGHDPESDGIAFLKEQAWQTPGFRTDYAAIGEVQETIIRTGRILPDVGAEARVTAPVAGRLALADRPPTPGLAVRRGDLLARLHPLPEEGGSPLPDARHALADAEADRDRAARLVASGAAPALELEEADRRLRAAREALAGLPGGGQVAEDGSVSLRAPIDGRIAEAHLDPGARVEAGTTVVRIVDPSRLRLVIELAPDDPVPSESSGPILFRLEGDTTARRSGAIVGPSPEIDPATRSRLLYVRGPEAIEALVPGRMLRAEIPLGRRLFGTTVPESALLDEDGRTVVYVQTGGELFERRPVTVLARAGGTALLGPELAEGERVVTGAPMAVRLASLSSTVPAHGHAH